jgi:hypothetical protein
MSCCSACSTNGCACGCGTRAGTPLSLYNAPGSTTLQYRVGTYADFFATMAASLSDSALPALADLRTRERDDFSMSLIDAWAATADVLALYQERIANEGYLRTATERASVLELARLVDYRVRPGVAANVYLAYTIEKDSLPVVIPQGARAQSVPAPGEQMQSFETSQPLLAREEWNALQPRLTQPQSISVDNVTELEELWVAGIANNLRTNDRLLFLFGDLETGLQAIRFVKSVELRIPEVRTRAVLQPMDAVSRAVARVAPATLAKLDGTAFTGAAELASEKFYAEVSGYRRDALRGGLGFEWYRNVGHGAVGALGEMNPAVRPVAAEFWKSIDRELNRGKSAAPGEGGFRNLFAALVESPTLQPANNLRLQRNVADALGRTSDTRAQLLVSFRSRLADTFYTAWTNAPVRRAADPLSAVFVMRVSAPLFGYNAPPIMGLVQNPDEAARSKIPFISRPDGDPAIADDEEDNHIFLDNAYDAVMADSYVIIYPKPQDSPVIGQAQRVQIRPRTAYGISGRTTEIQLAVANEKEVIWTVKSDRHIGAHVRKAQVYAQSEQLTLANVPMDTDVGPGNSITLDAAVDGLQAGSWVIVEGQRTDVPGTDAITAAEVVMLESVTQETDSALSSDTIHSTLHLANAGLAFRYKRSTVSVYANVVNATHGETRSEVLGSGNGTQAMQAFTLKQSPLTFVSAATAQGVNSTLEVRVNGVRWHEVENLAFAAAADRSFVTSVDADAKATVIFGDGVHGARLPTGTENVVAVYRNSIGAGGNVKARQISLLANKPLGVKEVINPVRASGGADAESRDQARENVPLAVLALDRLVAVRDYADFSRTFAGVGKAAATKVRDFVQVTIAGANDVPIETTSDLYRNLLQALMQLGDPALPVRIDVRELLALTLSAKVGLQPDYVWESVEPQVRAAVLERFGFQAMQLAQNVYLSEVIACIQAVRGVAWVDVDAFGSIDEATVIADFAEGDDSESSALAVDADTPLALVRARAAGYDKQGVFHPAQLAHFLPNVPDTLLLQEATR